MCAMSARCAGGTTSSTAFHPHRFTNRSTTARVLLLNRLNPSSSSHGASSAGTNAGSCAARSACGSLTAATLTNPRHALTTSRSPRAISANTAGRSSGTEDTSAAENSYRRRASAITDADCIVGVAPTTPARTVMKNFRTPTPTSER